MKKTVKLNGSVVHPVTVGEGAVLIANGKVYHTSRVVAIHEYTSEYVSFETLNTHYSVYAPTFPFAAVSPLKFSAAA